MNLFFSVFHFKFCEIKCVSVFKLVFDSDDAGMVFIFQNYSCCFVFNFVSERFILRKLWNFKIFSNVRENLFRTSVFSNLFLRISPFLHKFSLAIHQTVMILQLSKKVCCHYVNFVQVRRIFLFYFSRKWTQRFLYFVYKILFSFVLFWIKLLRNLDLFIIASERSFVIMAFDYIKQVFS